MKSTQDLARFVTLLDQHLRLQRVLSNDEQISLEIYPDKSFRINKNDALAGAVLFDSDEQDGHIDINDLAYHVPQQMAAEIKENLSIANIKVEDL